MQLDPVKSSLVLDPQPQTLTCMHQEYPNGNVEGLYLETAGGNGGEPAKEDALARLMAIAGKNHSHHHHDNG